MQDLITFQKTELSLFFFFFFSDSLSAFCDLFKYFVSAYHVLGAG